MSYLPPAEGSLSTPAFYLFEDSSTMASGPHPFYRENKRHYVYDKTGRWIGDDLKANETPCRLVTVAADNLLSGREIIGVFRRYATADYGGGEAGFATYEIPRPDDPITVWLIDDAVRTPEGEPPARDPKTSPGPLTLLLPSDY
jgi:hypothetical protein